MFLLTKCFPICHLARRVNVFLTAFLLVKHKCNDISNGCILFRSDSAKGPVIENADSLAWITGDLRGMQPSLMLLVFPAVTSLMFVVNNSVLQIGQPLSFISCMIKTNFC